MSVVVDVKSTHHPEQAGRMSAWLLKLANVVNCQKPVTGAQIATYVEMLIRDVPEAAFTNDALHYVSGQCEWWPPVKVLSALLSEWWKSESLRRQNAKASNAPQLEGPRSRRTPLAGVDLEWRRFWDRRELTGWREEGENFINEADIPARKSRALSLIRSQSSAAYEEITNRPARQMADNAAWSDPVTVRRSAVQARASKRELQDMLRAAVRKHAPENLRIVDEVLGAR
ncbi:hypothetical protein [Acetobacter lambici]|uniref:Uncharacterized protein n=1 Tax=Acetobacter lambici TaxID=1332824 RepID=A0ABT1F337_9PROT|nr:hypothetical protein [Acetobacter lambici]MCP1243028.1 hypothetical protein [Acetobacter lambici]MCP1258538.1 hypothetical protein [Acetobacter lambici]